MPKPLDNWTTEYKARLLDELAEHREMHFYYKSAYTQLSQAINMAHTEWYSEYLLQQAMEALGTLEEMGVLKKYED